MAFRICTGMSDVSGSIFDFSSPFLVDDIDIAVAHTLKFSFS